MNAESGREQDVRTYSMEVAYKGAPFSGFAKQPGQLTVQGELEGALALLFRQDVPTVCAGRTDAGVHGRGQVVSFSLCEEDLRGRSLDALLRSLNALTHEDIMVRGLEERDAGFSARFDAKRRRYRYLIFNGPTPPLFMRDFSWHVSKPLDLEAMEEAARYFIGEHDFKSFCLAVSAEGRRTMRRVEAVNIFTEEVFGEEVVVIEVIGNAFLHSMVRAMVGSLVAVGKGLRAPSWIVEVLEAKDRKAAGENAPAQGLVLWSVDY